MFMFNVLYTQQSYVQFFQLKVMCDLLYHIIRPLTFLMLTSDLYILVSDLVNMQDIFSTIISFQS